MADIAILPEEQQVDALLHFFSTVLHEMPTDAIQEKRSELMERFSHCGCSYETCATLLELVDQHVMRREQIAAREKAEARRAAKAARRAAAPTGIALAPAFASRNNFVPASSSTTKR